VPEAGHKLTLQYNYTFSIYFIPWFAVVGRKLLQLIKNARPRSAHVTRGRVVALAVKENDIQEQVGPVHQSTVNRYSDPVERDDNNRGER